MRGSRKFCQRGYNYEVFFVFFLEEGREIPKKHLKLAIIGPLERADDGLILNAGLVAL